MAAPDPFEVRMRFTSQLQHLNASVTSAQKAANYALRYKDMDEDLHSCILEQLERNNMNNRANIMYFIEHLCDLAQKENHVDYIRMMQRDILRVIDAVAPSDGSGAANVKVVRRVLHGLQQKEVLIPETVQELEECLKDRDTSINGDAGRMSTPHGGRANGAVRPDKRQIEQRIEEDRERHKKQRESIWAVKGEHEEFEKQWEDGSDVEEDDEFEATEDGEQRGQAVEFG
ncbi:CTD kinase subunit gamma [Rhizodiscina lignyota]|uniref:CTD kinase subunit gamma n=1 Tax=Rhizodiscina lignyota TaxID=1504668 RepID=A0A9P4IL08_9PEZI|nr:CTD kinase subunit gamma [Rhizodiscina lignyota]